MSNIEAVIFDMDGVTVDSEPLQVRSFNQTLRKYGVRLSKHQFKGFVGIEDTSVGVLAATSANMRCIAMPNYFTKGQDFSKAFCVVGDLFQAKDVIKENFGGLCGRETD